jgi:hypothetical protein
MTTTASRTSPAGSTMFTDPAGRGGPTTPGQPGRPGTGGPDGSRMQTWYITANGREVRGADPVPVGQDNRRTAHVQHRCPGGLPGSRCAHVEWLLPGAKKRHCPEHGKALAPAVTAERRKALASDSWRLHRAAAAPWAALVATAGVGVYAQAADVSPATVGLAAPLVAGVTYVVARHVGMRRAVKLRRVEAGQRTGKGVARVHRAAIGAAVAAAGTTGWVDLVTAAHPRGAELAAVYGGLAAAWAVACVPWWRHVDVRRRPVAAASAAQPSAPATVEVDEMQRLVTGVWAKLIGGPQGPLANTELVDYKRLPACAGGGPDRKRLPNWTATVRATVPGSINMREVRTTLLGRIAAAYGCSYADVSFTADESDLSIAYLRVQPDNPLAQPRLWPGPASRDTWAKGVSVVGLFDDGAPIEYVWWNSLGAPHDLMSGCTGSGKSELVALLILESLHSHGLVLDWLGDPQGGQSYGALKRHVDYFARSTTEIVFMLLAAKKEMLRRNDVLAAADAKTWRPSVDMPLMVITLDEVQSYIDDPNVLQLVEDLAAMGRKCGIKMRLITQVPAAYSLGGSSVIKEQLVAGQAFTFRAATDIAGRLAVTSDSPFDPTQLPKRWSTATCAAGEPTAGLMFVQGVRGRDVYGRGFHTGDDQQVWLVDADGQPTISPGQFGEEAQAVSGPLWGLRHQRAAAELSAGRSDADLLASGAAAELIVLAEQIASGVTRLGTSALQVASPAGGDATAADVLFACAVELTGPAGGVVTKGQLVQVSADMNTNTRDKAIQSLLGSGRFTRDAKRKGEYAVNP